MALHTYDPAQVSIIWGPIIVDGFADGTFVNVERNEDSFTLQVGTDGEACRSKSNNNSGRVTVTLLQSSDSNQLISAAHATDMLSPLGDGILPLMVKDNSGSSLFSAEKAWVVRPSTSAFGREAESREWIFETDNLVMNVGGN